MSKSPVCVGHDNIRVFIGFDVMKPATLTNAMKYVEYFAALEPEATPLDAVFRQVHVTDDCKGEFGKGLTPLAWVAWKKAALEIVEELASTYGSRITEIVVGGTAFLPLFTYLSVELLRNNLGAAKIYCLNIPFTSAGRDARPQLFDLADYGPSLHPAVTVTDTPAEGDPSDPPVLFITLNPAMFPLQVEGYRTMSLSYFAKEKREMEQLRSEPWSEDEETVDCTPLTLRTPHINIIRHDMEKAISKLGATPGTILVQLAVNDAIALAFGQILRATLIGDVSRVHMGIRNGPDMEYYSLERCGKGDIDGVD